MRKLFQLIEWVEKPMMAIATLSLAAIMVIIAVDVALRYFFHSPVEWAYDVISLYLMTALFFLALSDSFAENAHVNVDIFLIRFPPMKRVSIVVTTALSALLMGAICYLGVLKTWVSWSNGETVHTTYTWPTWSFLILVPVGTAILVGRLVIMLINALAGGPLPRSENDGYAE